MTKLSRAFYERDGLTVSKELLGKVLVHDSPVGRTAGRIVEVEAYMGPGDAAAHTYKNLRSERTAVIHGPGGYAYVYLIYGMYNCFNVVANVAGKPEALLIRALEPVEGIDLMAARRYRKRDVPFSEDSEKGKGKLQKGLCSGPGKLCQAMGVTKGENAADLCGDTIYILDAPPVPEGGIVACPRINIDYSGEAVHYPWRFLIKDNPYISKKP